MNVHIDSLGLATMTDSEFALFLLRFQALAGLQSVPPAPRPITLDKPPRPVPQATDKGPNETLYNERFGMSLRITPQMIDKLGTDDREEIALACLDAGLCARDYASGESKSSPAPSPAPSPPSIDLKIDDDTY